ncbi:hypothetical protein [Halopiger xanaduensis]|nr:hypothetical protein [Halopiger xanaduensis]
MGVLYDFLRNEPQWSSPLSELRDIEVVADRLPDRLLETRTIAVMTG